MIKRPGRQPTISEKLSGYYSQFAKNKGKIIIHHITEDTPRCLQIEVERRHEGKVIFERVVILD